MIFLIISKDKREFAEFPDWESAATEAQKWYGNDLYAVVLLDDGKDGNDGF